MKKTIVVVILVLILGIVAIPIAALGAKSGLETSPSSRTASIVERAEKAAVSRPQVNAASNALKALQTEVRKLRDQIRENQLRLEKVHEDNQALRLELRTLLAKNRDELTPAVRSELKVLRQQIQTLTEQLTESKGQIREILSTIKPMIEQRDWDAVKAALESVLSIQDARMEKLEQLNDLLKAAIKLVK